MKRLCLADKTRNGRVAVGETIVNTTVLDDSLLNPRRDCDRWDTKIYIREIYKNPSLCLEIETHRTPSRVKLKVYFFPSAAVSV